MFMVIFQRNPNAVYRTVYQTVFHAVSLVNIDSHPHEVQGIVRRVYKDTRKPKNLVYIT